MTADPGASAETKALEEETQRLKRRGWWGTGIWGLIVAVYWTATIWGGETRLLTLSEFGDFFAGVSAPIAFLWLVVGYYQQGLELRHNSRELSKQEVAMRASLKMTQDQLDLAAASAIQQTRVLKMSMQPRCDLEWEEPQPDAAARNVLGVIMKLDETVHFKLINLGHQVTEIDLKFPDDRKHEGIGIRVFPVWKLGSELTGAVRLPKGDKETREIKITYVDGMGDREWQKYVFRRDQFGIYELRLDSESIRRFWEFPPVDPGVVGS